jgi:hypothetical protein
MTTKRISNLANNKLSADWKCLVVRIDDELEIEIPISKIDPICHDLKLAKRVCDRMHAG